MLFLNTMTTFLTRFNLIVQVDDILKLVPQERPTAEQVLNATSESLNQWAAAIAAPDTQC